MKQRRIHTTNSGRMKLPLFAFFAYNLGKPISNARLAKAAQKLVQYMKSTEHYDGYNRIVFVHDTSPIAVKITECISRHIKSKEMTHHTYRSFSRKNLDESIHTHSHHKNIVVEINEDEILSGFIPSYLTKLGLKHKVKGLKSGQWAGVAFNQGKSKITKYKVS